MNRISNKLTFIDALKFICAAPIVLLFGTLLGLKVGGFITGTLADLPPDMANISYLTALSICAAEVVLMIYLWVLARTVKHYILQVMWGVLWFATFINVWIMAKALITSITTG